jgi:hypothetical protein
MIEIMELSPFTSLAFRRCFMGIAGLAILGWVDVPRANASCGDYVHIGNPGKAAPGLMSIERGNSVSGWIAGGAHLPKPPCSGPQCRGEVPRPVVPPAVPVQLSHSEMALPTPQLGAFDVAGEAIDQEAVSGIPAGLPLSLFRPPR